MTDREMLMMELEIRELEDRISYQEDLLKIAKQEKKAYTGTTQKRQEAVRLKSLYIILTVIDKLWTSG